MKKIILLSIVFLTFPAIAEKVYKSPSEATLTAEEFDASEARTKKCTSEANFHAAIASMRDAHIEPKVSLRVISSFPEITFDEGKRIINAIYFDQEFKNIRGLTLSSMIKERCLAASHRPFEPLK